MDEDLYPFARPEGPFHLGLRPLPRRRLRIAAIGALAGPARLAETLGPGACALIEPAWLVDRAVVWAARVTLAGWIPATLLPWPGRARIHLLLVEPKALPAIDAREGVPFAYRRVPVRVVRADGAVVDALGYEATSGPLLVDGRPVACAHAPLEGAPLPALDQRGLCDLVAWNLGLASGAALRRLVLRDPLFARELAGRLEDLRSGLFAPLFAPPGRG